MLSEVTDLQAGEIIRKSAIKIGSNMYALRGKLSTLEDAFGRARISQPFTLFDSKQIFDNQPLFWDDQEVSGSGTSSIHSANTASTVMSVSANTAGKRVRQTFQRFNYQPGKSHLIMMTANIDAIESGISASVGYFDDNNGLFFRIKNQQMEVVQRSNVTGTPVDEAVPQSEFNLDKLDGKGPSGFNIDPTKCQILFIDMEWLGVGATRFGFVVDGIFIYCHAFLNTNTKNKVFMSTPNLPVRYEIENDGTAGARSIEHICSSVISEGGQENIGVLRHADSGSISTLGNSNTYAVMGIRLKSSYIGLNVLLEAVSMICTSGNDLAHWELFLNPTVAGTFTYSDQTNSGVQIANGSSSNTITGGYEIDGGYFNSSLPVVQPVKNALRLGSAIDGTVDEIIFAVRPITNNITVQASITWRELL